jgi:hypothetical protein
MKYIALALVHLKSKLEKVATMVEDKSRPLDIYQPQTLTVEANASITLQPAWETPEKISSIIITGPPTSSTAAPSGGNAGNVTTPGAGATIVNTAAINGLYNVTVTVWVSGTVGAGDNDNMQLVYGSTVINLSDGTTPITYPFQINPANNGLSVKAINAGTAGAVYHAAITYAPASPNPATTMTLQLGDRTWNLTMPSTGIIVVAPVGIMLSRSDVRIFTASTSGEYTLELMGYADTRGNLV